MKKDDLIYYINKHEYCSSFYNYYFETLKFSVCDSFILYNLLVDDGAYTADSSWTHYSAIDMSDFNKFIRKEKLERLCLKLEIK